MLPKVTAEQQAGTVVPIEVASARLGTAPPGAGRESRSTRMRAGEVPVVIGKGLRQPAGCRLKGRIFSRSLAAINGTRALSRLGDAGALPGRRRQQPDICWRPRPGLATLQALVTRTRRTAMHRDHDAEASFRAD